MVNFRDKIIDPGRESRVAGAWQDLRGVGSSVSWHYDGPVDREDFMEELEDCFCVMTIV